MFWGSFGAVHLLSLGLGAGLIWSLYRLLRRFSRKVQVMVLGILSLSGIAAILFNLAMWGSPFEYLPLHLCSLNALVLPFAVFTRNKTLNNLLLLWALGALVALVVNTAQANFILFSPTFCFYFFPHLLEFGIPVLMFRLGLVKKDFRCIATTLPITFIVYTLIHFANLALNHYLAAHHVTNPSGSVVQVNYMYSLQPENPVLAWFWSLIPFPYWYMLPVILIAAVYLCLIYRRQIADHMKGIYDQKHHF